MIEVLSIQKIEASPLFSRLKLVSLTVEFSVSLRVEFSVSLNSRSFCLLERLKILIVSHCFQLFFFYEFLSSIINKANSIIFLKVVANDGFPLSN